MNGNCLGRHSLASASENAAPAHQSSFSVASEVGRMPNAHTNTNAHAHQHAASAGRSHPRSLRARKQQRRLVPRARAPIRGSSATGQGHRPGQADRVLRLGGGRAATALLDVGGTGSRRSRAARRTAPGTGTGWGRSLRRCGNHGSWLTHRRLSGAREPREDLRRHCERAELGPPRTRHCWDGWCRETGPGSGRRPPSRSWPGSGRIRLPMALTRHTAAMPARRAHR